jgi:hypothetical protein
MATTTNYGWTTPDDTALVKDGAAAIRTLGSSVDTTTKNLNPETTLGDLAYRSSTANVKTRLGLGTAGQVLTVNSGANAPEWATPASGGMTLINTGGTTLTGASVTISSIPSTYQDLRLIIRNFKPATDNAYLYAQINSDATANRYTDTFSSNNDVSGGVARSFNDTGNQISSQQDNTAADGITVVDYIDYTNTTTWRLAYSYSVGNNATTTTSANLRIAINAYNQTVAISSLKLLPSSGNFTSGTAYLYGVK